MKRERESQHRIAGLPFSLYPQWRLKLQPFNRATDPWAVLPPGSPAPCLQIISQEGPDLGALGLWPSCLEEVSGHQGLPLHEPHPVVGAGALADDSSGQVLLPHSRWCTSGCRKVYSFHSRVATHPHTLSAGISHGQGSQKVSRGRNG